MNERREERRGEERREKPASGEHIQKPAFSKINLLTYIRDTTAR
jgi:hypothetical protein